MVKDSYKANRDYKKCLRCSIIKTGALLAIVKKMLMIAYDFPHQAERDI